MQQMRWMVVGAVVVGLLAGQAGAVAVSWDANGGTGGDWNTAANWSTDTVPVSTDDVSINSNTSQANPCAISTAAAVANSLMIGYSSNTGYLSIANNLTVTGTMTVGRKGTTHTGYAWQTTGTVSVGSMTMQSGGIQTSQYDISGGTLAISGNFDAQRGDTGFTMTFNQSGNSVVTVGGTFKMNYSGVVGTGTGLYDLQDGSLTVTGTTTLGYKNIGGSCEFRQSDGTARFADINVGTSHSSAPGEGQITLKDAADFSMTGTLTLGTTNAGMVGTGILKLDGSKSGTGAADMAVGNNFLLNTANSVLEAVIDQAAINTATDMRKIVVTGTTTFANGSTLKVGFDGGATPTPGTWTLLTSTGTMTDSGLTLSADAGWSFNANTTTGVLTVTYVPEPATLALLGLGGLGLLLRRRR